MFICPVVWFIPDDDIINHQMVGFDPGVSRLGGGIVIHYTTDMQRYYIVSICPVAFISVFSWRIVRINRTDSKLNWKDRRRRDRKMSVWSESWRTIFPRAEKKSRSSVTRFWAYLFLLVLCSRNNVLVCDNPSKYLWYWFRFSGKKWSYYKVGFNVCSAICYDVIFVMMSMPWTSNVRSK